MTQLSRRGFVALTAAGMAGAPLLPTPASAATMTVQQVIDRVRTRAGADGKSDTVDTIKAGDPATVVTGIVTTALATMDVLKEAARVKANLVITCEPTFHSRADRPVPAPGRGGAPVAPDPIVTAKADFIAANGLVVWRFSDGWKRQQPDPFARGLGETLGWTRVNGNDPADVTIPETTLERLTRHVKDRLDARGGVRVVGDPTLRVRRVALLPGTTAIGAALRAFADADVVVAGEVREWESVEYARDLRDAGEKKALVLLGRILSEDPGMNACARWLRTVIRDVNARWIPAGDPYWRPA
jgi:putative NIF3 family GTP cyclohydrolase 1 type 2